MRFAAAYFYVKPSLYALSFEEVCRALGKTFKGDCVALNETLQALENIIDRMDEILDALKESILLVQEIAQNGGDLNQLPGNVLSRLKEVVVSLDALPWILTETGLDILMTPFQSVPKQQLN